MTINHRIAKLVTAFCLTLTLASVAFAHDPGLSAAVLKLNGDRVEAHLTYARADIELLVPLDADRDGVVSATEFSQAKSQLESLAAESIAVTANGQSVSFAVSGVELDNSNGVHFRFSFAKPEGEPFVLQSALIERLPRGHRQYVELIGGEKLIGSKMLMAGATSYQPTAAALAEAAQAGQSFWEFFKLGLEHIAFGFDHLAFLFALLLAGSKLREAIKIITSFTVAHSITLALATFDVVNLPSWIVEPMIAVSIVYVGLENIFRREVSHRWLLTFAFGLIHGFGFASVLRELGIAEQGSTAIVPLFSFNFGVELGQIAIAALILPLIWKLREQPKFVTQYVTAFSLLIALAGGYWLVERTIF
ncbi:MAG: HupE/UreJ family protein [Acidobacteriota bacterium]|nr:HupE/UreJ family protein [Acidobacteriota bacterium]